MVQAWSASKSTRPIASSCSAVRLHGKSTLLKAVAGFITPSEGEIRLQGQAVGRRPAPTVSWCSRSSTSCRHGRPYGRTCCFPAGVRPGGARRGRATRRRMPREGRPGGLRRGLPAPLSGGMKARVAIARALAMQPKILLMDEPFAALDALTRRKMQEELLRLWEEVRFTLLFVTHSIEEALVVGNRILLLSPHPGRVRAEVHGHPFGLHSLGGEALQAAARRIHRLLFDEGGEPTAAETLDFADIRLAH
ncbi:ATP-binding cassette domain-containing protein [Pseudomonas aeruginosa]|nr:ATP-binding cassette domain-containing protein [Pseudomonas aeruginosa]